MVATGNHSDFDPLREAPRAQAGVHRTPAFKLFESYF